MHVPQVYDKLAKSAVISMWLPPSYKPYLKSWLLWLQSDYKSRSNGRLCDMLWKGLAVPSNSTISGLSIMISLGRMRLISLNKERKSASTGKGDSEVLGIKLCSFIRICSIEFHPYFQVKLLPNEYSILNMRFFKVINLIWFLISQKTALDFGTAFQEFQSYSYRIKRFI